MKNRPRHPDAVTGQLIVLHFGMDNAPPRQKKRKSSFVPPHENK